MNRIVTLILALMLTGCLGDRDSAEDANPTDGTNTTDQTEPTDQTDPVPTDQTDTPPTDSTEPGTDVEPVDLLADGAACLVDGECTSGRCAVTCEASPVCVPATCATDADCGGPTSDGAAVCCMGGTCSPVAGASCGDRSGGSGAGCHAGGDSACKDGLSCLGSCLPSAVCAAPCSTEADCANPMVGCYPVAGGDKYCIGNPDLQNTCALDNECSAGEVCDLLLSFAGDEIVQKCASTQATGAVGSKCSSGQQCKLGFCWTGPGQTGVCGAVCTEDADCACQGGGCYKDQICVPIVFSLMGGALDAAPLCYEGTRCASNGECIEVHGEGAECAATWHLTEMTPLCQVVPAMPGGKGAGSACQENAECSQNRCLNGKCYNAVAAGESCGTCAWDEAWCDAICTSGTCFDGRCTTVCTDDTDCESQLAGAVCVNYGFQVKGGDNHVPICIRGPRCTAKSQCDGAKLCYGFDEGEGWATVCDDVPSVKGGLAAGATCTYDSQCAAARCASGVCKTRQPVGGACEVGKDCETGLCAAATCAEPCAEDGDCGAGTCATSVVPTASNPTAKLTVCVP